MDDFDIFHLPETVFAINTVQGIKEGDQYTVIGAGGDLSGNLVYFVAKPETLEPVKGAYDADLFVSKEVYTEMLCLVIEANAILFRRKQ